ncbi:MAG: nuclease-related domain-containing protein [Bacillota bacterium]|nr:nuclease-related domain-containing protein [Bacillota bacterium]
MIIKARKESESLKILRSLNYRMELTATQQKYYFNLEKGYEGEVQFDRSTEKIQTECLILNDLLLEVNNTKFQIDSLIIFKDMVYHFEVKNYEGDYYYEADNLLTISKKEIKNPFDQLKRGQSLLRQLFQQNSITFPIDSLVIFINPEFSLYQAPLNMPFIFQSQLTRFLKKLNNKPSVVNDRHKKLAEKLVSLHQPESLFPNIPAYNFGQLKKGNLCAGCGSFSMIVRGKKLYCSNCGFGESTDFAVMRTIDEYKILFPQRTITTNEIYEWGGEIVPKRVISRILGKNFEKSGVHQWSIYQ